jgi:hypothetical protein
MGSDLFPLPKLNLFRDKIYLYFLFHPYLYELVFDNILNNLIHSYLFLPANLRPSLTSKRTSQEFPVHLFALGLIYRQYRHQMKHPDREMPNRQHMDRCLNTIARKQL